MQMKPIHIIGILVGIAALAALLYFIGAPREMEPLVIYKTTRLNTSKTDPTTPAQHSDTENNGRFPRANATQGDTAADAQGNSGSAQQRLKVAMTSPAYHEYSRKQAEQVGFNIVLWWEFLEAAGISHNGRQLQAEAFEKHFPDGGDYADYEPMMRLAVAELFLEDPEASVMDVLQRFNADRPNRVWRFGYFNGYEGEYEWGQQIQRDAVDIVANAIAGPETFQVPPLNDVPPDAAVPVRDATPEASTFEPRTDAEEIPTLDALETLPQTFEALEAQFFEQHTVEIPDLPSETQLETTLRERFSPDRFNTAMQTLRHYGPREGLRHLKASDPEVAAYIQRHLRPNAETDETQ